MLVQDYLSTHGPEHLASELAIKLAFHPTDERVILNYDMIDSPKHNEIVKECRGLVLNRNDWSLVARSFPRFFNLGECESSFDWDNSVFTNKEDGSLILLYCFNGDWHANTRGSYSSGEIVQGTGLTWRNIIDKCVSYNRLDPNLTYVCELCSPYNKIVRMYTEPKLYLLSAFYKEEEIPLNGLHGIGADAGLQVVAHHTFSLAQLNDELERVAKSDPTFEGYVGRDISNNRLKVKSLSYLALHRLSNNGNIKSVKNIIPLIVSSEVDEVLVYFPELKDLVVDVQTRMGKMKEQVLALWERNKDEVCQKTFALAVKDHPCSSVLFQARKLNCNPLDLMDSDFWERVLC